MAHIDLVTDSPGIRGLFAAAFCMFDRDVDGLPTFAPRDREDHVPMAERIVAQGYLASY